LIRPKGELGSSQLALETAAGLLPILSDLVGHPFPFPKLDFVAVPKPFRYGMENPGLITWGAERLLLEPGRSSAWQEKALVQVLAHEIAHQWTGDLVTPRWWNDIWLNEGFATFLEARAVDRWRPSFGAQLAQLALIARSMDSDMEVSERPVREDVFSVQEAERISHYYMEYDKGAAFLGALERFIGRDAFWRALTKYVGDNAWKSVGTDDFVATLESVSGQRVTAFANMFLSRAGLPVVSIERSCNGDRLQAITVRQEEFTFDPPDPQ
jgi:aminopeptidase N